MMLKHIAKTADHTSCDISRIEALIMRDVGRGMSDAFAATKGNLELAARMIASHPAPRILILTGFYVSSAEPPAAETDGPVGAALMAACLANAGIRVEVMTDALCADVVDAALRAAGSPATLYSINADEASAQAALSKFLYRPAPPTHILAIERMGPAADGKCYSMRGRDLSSFAAPLHVFFTHGMRPWRTIAFGDGGNELGMGSLPQALCNRTAANGRIISCVVPADVLVTAGVSNWLASAFISALALLRPELAAALTALLVEGLEKTILAASVDEGGAVDGVTLRRSHTVDGLAWDDYFSVPAAIFSR